MSLDVTTMPVFRPMKSRAIILGLGTKEWLRVVMAFIIGALLAFTLGLITTERYIPLSISDAQSYYSQLTNYRNVLTKAERVKKAPLKKEALTREEKNALEEAQALGVSADMTNDELRDLVPEKKLADQPLFPLLPRWIFCCALPLMATVVLNVEISQGTSLLKELTRALKHRRSQRTFYSQPKRYVSSCR